MPDNMTHIVSGNPEVLYEKIIEPQISRYMGAIFEEICIQYLIMQNYKIHYLLCLEISEDGEWKPYS